MGNYIRAILTLFGTLLFVGALAVSPEPVLAQRITSPSLVWRDNISGVEAAHAFQELRQQLPWSVGWDGCSARAFACWEYFQGRGIRSHAVIMRAAIGNHFMFQGNPWIYHVACWVLVDGTPKLFDPGTQASPVEFSQWYLRFPPLQEPTTPNPKRRQDLGPGVPGCPAEGEPPWVVAVEGWDVYPDQPAPSTAADFEGLRERNRERAHSELENITWWLRFYRALRVLWGDI